MIDAASFLDEAADILKERGQSYDAPEGERSMARAVQAFNAITGSEMIEAEGWLFMSLLKRARQWQRGEFHRDSALDAIGYAALEAEALARG